MTKAFRALKQLGYFARQNLGDCLSCGSSLIPDECRAKFVFYHQQDRDRLVETGSCYLAWAGDGAEIVQVLQQAGLAVEWDGNDATGIKVTDPDIEGDKSNETA